jgi:hypothetical protein
MNPFFQEEAEQLQPQPGLAEGQQQLRGQVLHELGDRPHDLLRGCQAAGKDGPNVPNFRGTHFLYLVTEEFLGQCYDRYFCDFSHFSAQKMAFFLKINAMINCFCINRGILSQNRQIYIFIFEKSKLWTTGYEFSAIFANCLAIF